MALFHFFCHNGRKEQSYECSDRLFEMHLSELKSGHTVDSPLYNFVTYERMEDVKKVKPEDVIIAEGIYSLYDESIRELCDIKVYVDTDSDLRALRKIDRDVRERGRSLKFSMDQYI